MSIIEQATRRLEELRRAGIEVPSLTSEAPAAGSAARLWRSEGHLGAAGGSVVPLNGQEAVHTPPRTTDKSRQPESATTSPSRYLEIDLERLAAQGYLTPNAARGPLEDEIRIIRMQIVKTLNAAAATDKRANVVVVTSAVPGEGKTFFAMNLAMSVAMGMDLRAVLVDADVLRPCIGSRYGIPPGPGLLDLLRDPELPVEEVMFRTNVAKLSFIQAGTSSQRSAELLAGSAADRVLTELATRYADSILIFDAPPVLAATEARQLAARAGQVVVVVEADKTDSRLVGQAFAALAEYPLVSSVLNKRPGPPPGTAYGYYGV